MNLSLFGVIANKCLDAFAAFLRKFASIMVNVADFLDKKGDKIETALAKAQKELEETKSNLYKLKGEISEAAKELKKLKRKN